MRRVEVREGTSSTHPLCPVSLSRARALFFGSLVSSCLHAPLGLSLLPLLVQQDKYGHLRSPLPPCRTLNSCTNTPSPHTHTHTQHMFSGLWTFFPMGLGHLWSLVPHGNVMPTGHTQNKPKKITNPSPCYIVVEAVILCPWPINKQPNLQ